MVAYTHGRPAKLPSPQTLAQSQEHRREEGTGLDTREPVIGLVVARIPAQLRAPVSTLTNWSLYLLT